MTAAAFLLSPHPLAPPDRRRDPARHRPSRPPGANPGDFPSRKIGVFSGPLIILAITLVFVRWIGASRSSQLLGIGVLWGVLTLAFEILFGRFVVGASWERMRLGIQHPRRRAHAVRDGRLGTVAVDCSEVAGCGMTSPKEMVVAFQLGPTLPSSLSASWPHNTQVDESPDNRQRQSPHQAAVRPDKSTGRSDSQIPPQEQGSGLGSSRHRRSAQQKVPPVQ